MNTAFGQIPAGDMRPAFCGRCGRELPVGTATCPYCITPAGVSLLTGRVSGLVRASGRTRKAGYWICGGGIAAALSAFLPWVTIDNTDTSHPAGGGVLLLLAIGVLLAYFGGRVLQDRVSRAVNIALWVLAGVDLLLTVGLFAAEARIQREAAGIVSVSPAIGFYVGIGGLVASVVGTVLVQTVRRRPAGATRR
jgi:hypothetical protein